MADDTNTEEAQRLPQQFLLSNARQQHTTNTSASSTNTNPLRYSTAIKPLDPATILQQEQLEQQEHRVRTNPLRYSTVLQPVNPPMSEEQEQEQTTQAVSAVPQAKHDFEELFKAEFPSEKLIEKYECDLPKGEVFLTPNYLVSYSASKNSAMSNLMISQTPSNRTPIFTTKSLVIRIEDITHIKSLTKDQFPKISIETASKTYFLHLPERAHELYYLLSGMKKGWYAEYNAYFLKTFPVQPNESLIDCSWCFLYDYTTKEVRTFGASYISQSTFCFQPKTGGTPTIFALRDIVSVLTAKHLLESNGIKIVLRNDQAYWLGSFVNYLAKGEVKKILRALAVIEQVQMRSIAATDDLNENSSDAVKDTDLPDEEIVQRLERCIIDILSHIESIHRIYRLKKMAIPNIFNSYNIMCSTINKTLQKVLTDNRLFHEFAKESGFSLTATLRGSSGGAAIDIDPEMKAKRIKIKKITKADYNPEMGPHAGGMTGAFRICKAVLDKADKTLVYILDRYDPKKKYRNEMSSSQGEEPKTKGLLSGFASAVSSVSISSFISPTSDSIKKLERYHMQLSQISDNLELMYEVSLTEESERLAKFDIEQIVTKLGIESFWYKFYPSLKFFVHLLNTAKASFGTSFHHENPLLRYGIAMGASGYYFLLPSKTTSAVKENEKGELDPNFARFVWNLPDNPFISFFDHITIPSLVAIAKNLEVPHPGQDMTINVKLISAKKLPFRLPKNVQVSNWNMVTSQEGDTNVESPKNNSESASASAASGTSSSGSATGSSGTYFGASFSTNAPQGFKLEDLPVILHFHGGGFISMSAESHEVYLREWANMTQTLIVSVNYAKAPEHPWPCAPDQCFYIYKWLLGGALGFVPRTITLAGDSAGGNLVACVTIKALMEGIRPPDSIVMIYPALNLCKSATPSRLVNMNDPIVSYGFLMICVESYIPKDENPANCLISPLFAPDSILKNFPPTYIMGAAFDPLLDDYVSFAKRLISLGVDCIYKIYNDMPHGYLSFVKIVPQSKRTVQDAGLWLQLCTSK